MRPARAEVPETLGQAVGAREPGSLVQWVQRVMFAGLVLATVTAGLVGNGDLRLALVPPLLALLVCLVLVLPLRVPMLTLLVLAWALEVPGDAFAGGLVQTPWKVLGALLFAKLNLTVPFSPLVMTGLDLLVVLMVGVLAYRHHQRSMLDRAGWVNSPAPIGT